RCGMVALLLEDAGALNPPGLGVPRTHQRLLCAPHPARGVYPEPLRSAQGRSQRKGERARHPLPHRGRGESTTGSVAMAVLVRDASSVDRAVLNRSLKCGATLKANKSRSLAVLGMTGTKREVGFQG